MANVTSEKYIGLTQASQVLGVSYWTLRGWAKTGRIRYYKLGNRIQFLEKDLLNLRAEVRRVA